MQKLSALSASLARVVSTAEEEEAELDQFPVEEVRKPAHNTNHWILALKHEENLEIDITVVFMRTVIKTCRKTTADKLIGLRGQRWEVTYLLSGKLLEVWDWGLVLHVWLLRMRCFSPWEALFCPSGLRFPGIELVPPWGLSRKPETFLGSRVPVQVLRMSASSLWSTYNFRKYQGGVCSAKLCWSNISLKTVTCVHHSFRLNTAVIWKNYTISLSQT